ncbi:hypothetical protein EV424DRAFT_1330514 [Suillus variegatus]|nr:hypothetical protein EV424DRAFT_1330514 [Suillus variegatus]
MSLEPQPCHRYPNKTLIYYGYLGCSPLYPTIAISIHTLVNYCQCHRTCPRFSIEAQCKALCHLHNMPYQPYLNSQFSDMYNIYLEILHHIDHHLNEALHRNTPNWHLLNACPCCTYKLKDEPPLALEWLVSIDGNNSLKRWVSSTYGPRSDYWVDCTSVDIFKDEVQRSAVCIIHMYSVTEPVESEGSFNCTQQWQNAGPEQCKKMFSVFDESGIFIAACRHQFVLRTQIDLLCRALRGASSASVCDVTGRVWSSD